MHVFRLFLFQRRPLNLPCHFLTSLELPIQSEIHFLLFLDFVVIRRTLGGRKLWESKDDRKWGHDKYEELTLQERHHEQVSISAYASVLPCVCATLLFLNLNELICRVEGVLGVGLEVAVEIEAQMVVLHVETGPKST